MKRELFAGLLLLIAAPALAAPLSPDQKARIDALVTETLKSTGVSSASIAVVTDGKLDYARAYGEQRKDGAPATTTARYPIASVSKQFTAAALLLLAEDGKLSMTDRVSKYLPGLTDADKISIGQLLSHTAGYRDFWPQDFGFADMYKPVTAQAILDKWAKAPLDYAPGSKYQYSNTGYTAAGLIAEMLAGEPLASFEQKRIFTPLGMNVVQAETGLQPSDAKGFQRFALGPVRPVRPTAPGWGFAAGDLAMTPTDIAKWNIARLNRSLLKPTSWALQETSLTPVDSGVAYGLGVQLKPNNGHRSVEHNGGWEGFRSINRAYPDDKAAVTVFVNSDFSDGLPNIADGIARVLFDQPDDTATPRALFAMLQSGKIDRSRFTENGNFYFSPTVLGDYATSLAPLGEPKSITRVGKPALRGGLTSEVFTIAFPNQKMLAVLRAELGSGKIEQFTLTPAGE
ncbi:MAG: beta-lactamase family protein [Sandarakinorhabdus sp.]|nr:beta-lactamase family protein [Sandarakinorhabdus sp.]